MLLQGKTQTQRAGDQGRRPRRGRQAEGHADQRHARRQGRPGHASPPITFPEPVLSYAIEPKSRGDEDKISTSMHRLEEEDPSISYSRDPQTKELLLVGPGPAAHRGDGREAEAALRRRRQPQAAAHPVPRDDQGVDRGARPPQEADRRPRPVRRLQDQGRAAAARQRLRVRRRHLRRLDPAAVRPGGREGHPGRAHARLPRRLSRWSTSASTVFDGSYHDVDSNELSFKMAGSLAFKDAMTRARPTILEPVMNVEVYAPSRLRRRPDGRSQRPPRPHRAAWTRAARRRSSRRRCRCPRC